MKNRIDLKNPTHLGVLGICLIIGALLLKALFGMIVIAGLIMMALAIYKKSSKPKKDKKEKDDIAYSYNYQ